MSVEKIHLANILTPGKSTAMVMGLADVKNGHATSLETFWKKKAIQKVLDANPDIELFLDSGAHSLLNHQVGLVQTSYDTGIEGEQKDRDKDGNMIFSEQDFEDTLDTNQKISYASKSSGAVQSFTDFSFNELPEVRQYLKDYIEFVHKYKSQFNGYVNLDIVYNAEASWKNQEEMEDNGLSPVPVFHYGEDFKWFRKYVDNYPYIGIGGVAGGITLKQFVNGLGDKAFEYIQAVNPDIKVHGFAVTSFSLMHRYSWYSVDSTTWLKLAAYGKSIIPRYDHQAKAFDYTCQPLHISVSDLSRIKASHHPHYSIALKPKEVDAVEMYLDEIGIDRVMLGKDITERFKVNVYYYRKLLEEGSIKKRKIFRTTNSFF